MDLFLAGTNVVIQAPLTDRRGLALAPTAVAYRVVDETNTELLARTPATGFVLGATEVQIAIPAALNQLGAAPEYSTQSSRGLRQIELFLTLADGNEVAVSFAYGIEPLDVLSPGVNSFQSYAAACLIALDIPDTPGWDAASEDDRAAALIEARWNLCKLNYTLLNSNLNFGQNSLNWVPEGLYRSKYVATAGLFMFDGNLELLNADQFASLPTRFKAALCKAQIAEADAILFNDPVMKKRLQGLLSDAVGETRQTFRQMGPARLPASARALSYVSYFTSFSPRIGRA